MKSTDNFDSRYVQGGVTDVHPNRLGWWERTTFERDPTDAEFTITAEYHLRPDKLAKFKYGTAKYQFFILQYNNILDDITEFVEGNVILLPTTERLTLDIMTQPIGGNVV